MIKQLLFKGLACIALLSDEEENKISKHNRIWVHEMLRKRKIGGKFQTLYRELIDETIKFFLNLTIKMSIVNLKNVLLNT
jgi:hypothetical protein